MAEQWVQRYEIRDGDVYKNGRKLSDSEARDIKERFEHEQRIHAPVLPKRRLFGWKRRVG